MRGGMAEHPWGVLKWSARAIRNHLFTFPLSAGVNIRGASRAKYPLLSVRNSSGNGRLDRGLFLANVQSRTTRTVGCRNMNRTNQQRGGAKWSSITESDQNLIRVRITIQLCYLKLQCVFFAFHAHVNIFRVFNAANGFWLKQLACSGSRHYFL